MGRAGVAESLPRPAASAATDTISGPPRWADSSLYRAFIDEISRSRSIMIASEDRRIADGGLLAVRRLHELRPAQQGAHSTAPYAMFLRSEGNNGAPGRVWSASKWAHTSSTNQRRVRSAPLINGTSRGLGPLRREPLP